MIGSRYDMLYKLYHYYILTGKNQNGHHNIKT